MNPEPTDFIHSQHFSIFIDAARAFNCHILVRKTGQAALAWIRRSGYTGKRGDMKAKTANQNVGQYQIAGLVCSPQLQPGGFTPARWNSAQAEWFKCAHLITVPSDRSGFDDRRQVTGCRTPYIVQTNPGHKHYGCVAFVECGLLIPRYIHGDYDLYAIIPAGRPFDTGKLNPRAGTLGSTMTPDGLSLEQRLRFPVPNLEGPLSFRVASFINNRIAATSPDFLGALMVNHGEQINLGTAGQTFEPVLAFLPRPENGSWTKVLASRADHENFYRNA